MFRIFSHHYLVIRDVGLFCNPMDHNPPGSSTHGISQARYWSALPFPSPDLPDPGIKSSSHAWQVGSLPLSHSKCCKSSKTQIWLLATQNAILERQMLVEQEGSFIQEAGM